ncbi:MAG: chloride channel protein [Bacteroidales bacterium]|nr:chloride channel protein [Bacteroidales bacterium]
MTFKIFLNKLINWRITHLSEQNTVLVLSVFIGSIAAMAAIVLKNAVYFTHQSLLGAFPETEFNYLYLAFPIIGITLTVLIIKFFIKDDLSHGVTKVLYAISKKNGKIKLHNTYSSVLTSTITVGFGGSVGLEAPITLTGSAIGSQLASFFNLKNKSVILLAACGSTGAIAAIFNAPIAAIVFAIEVLMLDLTTLSLLPLLISAVTGTSLSYLFLGKSVMFNAIPTVPDFEMYNLPFYAILGLFGGFLSLYFMRITSFIEHKFTIIKKKYLKVIVGGVILSVLIFLFPSFYGEGYDNIAQLLAGSNNSLFINSPFYSFKYNELTLILFVFALLLFKPFATGFTNAAGGVGGVFAPLLYLGGMSGFFIVTALNFMFDTELSVLNFILAGMAGLMGSVMKAPLTAIFLIAEISGGYHLFIPLIITTVISYMVFYPFEKYSIYTKSLAKQGDLITHDKNKHALSKIDVKDMIEDDFKTLDPNANIHDLTKLIEKSNRNVFPVVDKQTIFYGVVLLDDVRNIIFYPKEYDTSIKQFIFKPEITIAPDESMISVVKKFKKTGYYNMPVIDAEGKYYGFISRANVYTQYREIVEEISED